VNKVQKKRTLLLEGTGKSGRRVAGDHDRGDARRGGERSGMGDGHQSIDADAGRVRTQVERPQAPD